MLSPLLTSRPKLDKPVECNPDEDEEIIEANVGVLLGCRSVSPDQVCLASEASSLGGFCYSSSSFMGTRSLQWEESVYGVCDPTSPLYQDYADRCSEFDWTTPKRAEEVYRHLLFFPQKQTECGESRRVHPGRRRNHRGENVGALGMGCHTTGGTDHQVCTRESVDSPLGGFCYPSSLFMSTTTRNLQFEWTNYVVCDPTFPSFGNYDCDCSDVVLTTQSGSISCRRPTQCLGSLSFMDVTIPCMTTTTSTNSFVKGTFW